MRRPSRSLRRPGCSPSVPATSSAAHRQAAAYWLSRGVPSPETGYHQRQAAELTRVAGPAPARIEVRVVAPDGTASYRRALATDIRARRGAGHQLLRAPRITTTPSARAALAAGRSTRLLITLATRADLTPGPDGYVLTIEFGAPAPLGMLR